MISGLDQVEQRILGCLLEKQRTTPDTYPLTLNALRLACNQSTNRDPVVDFDEETVYDGLQRMIRRELARNASGHGSRASKYRHLLNENVGIPQEDQAVLCVLLLRGPQTPGELKQRTERLHPFEDLEAIELALESLIEQGAAERLARQPGEKQVRYRHLLGDDDEDGDTLAMPAVAAPDPAPGPDLQQQIDELREQVAELTQQVAELRQGD